MCGIAGIWRPRALEPVQLASTVEKMTARLRHRGPDGDGSWVDAERRIALGHRRLAIVDLTSAGAQPMHSASGRFVVTFNGEIYNFAAIRLALEARGATFRSTSDTEVLLAAFEYWGVPASIRKLEGMFAIGVWDRSDECLWLIRDRIGEKPLYYALGGEGVVFASELKAIVASELCSGVVRARSVADVVERGYVRGSNTIYQDVQKVRPGEYHRFSVNGSQMAVESVRYWQPRAIDASGTRQPISVGDATNELDTLLQEVVKAEIFADVPVGAFLSGGIDSSLIAAIMQRVGNGSAHTFTIGFAESAFDESPFAKAVADHLGTDHTEIILSASDALAYVEQLPSIFDEPFADSSQLPTLLVCHETRKHVTVALSGDGGDELFGGYSQYVGRDAIGAAVARIPGWASNPARLATAIIPASIKSALVRGSEWPENSWRRVDRMLSHRDEATRYESLLSAVAEASLLMKKDRWEAASKSRDSDLVEFPEHASPQQSMMVYDAETYLPDDIMVKVDRCSMHASLETRAPLLHHRVVEFAFSQPVTHLIERGRGKLLLREVLSRYVPISLVDRPKRGFAIPVGAWLRGELRSWGESLLRPDLAIWTWLERETVMDLWRSHQAGNDHATPLWHVLVLSQWFRHNNTPSRL
jgi:asparagine synthase (glutamine-hydrolysing)